MATVLLATRPVRPPIWSNMRSSAGRSSAPYVGHFETATVEVGAARAKRGITGAAAVAARKCRRVIFSIVYRSDVAHALGVPRSQSCERKRPAEESSLSRHYRSLPALTN